MFYHLNYFQEVVAPAKNHVSLIAKDSTCHMPSSSTNLFSCYKKRRYYLKMQTVVKKKKEKKTPYITWTAL